MKIGMFTANFLNRDLESVFRMMADLGYEAAELPAFTGNGHLDIDEVLKPGGAKKTRDLAGKYGLTISALSNHPEGQLVLGPHTKDTDSLYPGGPGAPAGEKIRFGMDRMKQTARAAAALEVPVVCGFI
ncbi:MAG: sugar phosphate isomerase/epimerase family protein, partial [Spirochaetota bacterium]